MAERNLAKVEVAGSNPVVRSAMAYTPAVKLLALVAVLALAVAGCSGDDDSLPPIIPLLDVDGELLEVEELPHVHDDSDPHHLDQGLAVPFDLGLARQTLALPDGGYLVETAGPPGSVGCLARFGGDGRSTGSVCRGSKEVPLPEGQWVTVPLLSHDGLLAVANLPPYVVAVEHDGVVRSVEHGFVYFEDADSKALRYYGADGEELPTEQGAIVEPFPASEQVSSDSEGS